MKAPDLHKKRFRYNKYFDKVLSEDLYMKWKKEFPEHKDKINSYSSFKKVWGRIANIIKERVCDNPMGVELPYYCGILSIKYLVEDPMYINRRKSINEQYDVPFLNFHSSQKTGKLVWNTNRASRFNIMLPYYGFKGVREFNSRVNKTLNEKPEIFKTYSPNTSKTVSNIKKLHDK